MSRDTRYDTEDIASPYREISESVVLRCIASCLETSEYYVGKGNRPFADWWHNRADMYADRLEIYRQAGALAAQRNGEAANQAATDLRIPIR
jgi:hypothetical protein